MLERAGVDDVDLIKGKNGAFEIVVDGKLTFSKKATGRFPSDEEVAGISGGD